MRVVIEKWLLPALILIFLSAGILLASCATDNAVTDDAATLADNTNNKPADEASYLGSEICMECHEEHLYDLPNNKHWQKADPRTPGASENGCEICHGPGSHHLDMAGEIDAPGLIAFGKNANVTAEKRNAICLGCHQADVKHWQGSLHDTDDMSCASCHAMHHEHHTTAKMQEQVVCYSCHQNVRAETYRPFRHPIREELIFCTDCHNPHGSAGPAMLAQLTLNDNCYTCHAEKRGPYLWEHEPSSEDCGICHTPHGSLHPALLTSRPPLLCQQCHQSTRITHARQAFYFGKLPPEHKGGEGPGGGEGPLDRGGNNGGQGAGGSNGSNNGSGNDGGTGNGTGSGSGNGGAGNGGGQGPGDGTGTGSGSGSGSGQGPGDGTGNNSGQAATSLSSLANGQGSGGNSGGGHGDDHGDGHGGGDQNQDQNQDRGGDNQRQDRIQQGPGASRSQEGGSSRFLLGSMGGSCLNCHSQVHGSNHPSGVKLMR